jgi:formate dehydrogenase (coenzyme F420) beta subunit
VEELRNKAKELLESQQVKMVIGFGVGTTDRIRPVFAVDSAGAGELMYDPRCQNNLAVYLTRPEIRRLGRVALVAPLPVMRAVLQLAAEAQVTDSDVRVLGMTAEGKLIDMPDLTAVEAYVQAAPLDLSEAESVELNRIRALPAEERFRYWQEQLSRCFKCYACRQACPLCYCSRCTVDLNQPQWIPVPAHDIGNLEWHVMRAMHLAGRCVNCGECARACPLGIPLNVLNHVLAEEIRQGFGARGGTQLKLEYALSTFKPNDKENFIR